MDIYRRWRHRHDRPGTTTTIGTLLHRWQGEMFPGLWELTRNLHTRFIFVRRDNLLRHFMSELIAMRTGKWTSDPATVQNLPRMTVPIEAFRVFVDTRYRESKIDWEFQPRIDYSLERLMADWNAQIERIQRFLAVDPLPLKPILPQQETRSLPDMIANYTEVVKAVKEWNHSEWLD